VIDYDARSPPEVASFRWQGLSQRSASQVVRADRPAPGGAAGKVCILAGFPFLGLVFGFFGSRPERFCPFAMAASH
jgi:hypothetical protein